MGMSMGGGDGDAVAEINVTPLVDVLLCLLILFMVASPPPPGEQLPLSIPKKIAVETAGDADSTLLIEIGADGSAALGRTKLSDDYDQMVEQIAGNERAKRDNKVAVRAAPEVAYGAVIRVMAAAHDAGVMNVGIASSRL